MNFFKGFCRDYLLLPLVAVLVYGCSSKKETVTSRSMQNLTAHYNILYNASQQFKQAQTGILEAVPDDYSEVLTVYKEPRSAGAGKTLDSVIIRANTIIGDKAQSNYVDDAWMLTGKVNYLKTEFFNAAEFFNYVYHTYYDDKPLRQEALFWKARTLMRLNDMDAAAVALDSAMKHLTGSKHAIADVYAAEAQFNIRSGNEEYAAEMLKKALKEGSTRENTIRWSYVLAQLEEKNGHPDTAWNFYTAVVKSNASFEMAFNANLNRMKLKATGNTPESRIAALRSLLKPYKNRDFLDQIYFKIAEIQLEQGQNDQALKSYNLGLAKSTTNRNQKGLIYLKLADLNFENAEYVKAKAYYDSTLLSLSPEFPGYAGIKLKSSNLDLLAGKYKEISRQDTLQMLAKLPEGELNSRILTLVKEQAKKSGNPGNAGPFTAAIDLPGSTGGDGKFYFNNVTALSQGFSDFKKKWGNRKLEDNWRRGSKDAPDLAALATNNQATNSNTTAPGGPSGADDLLIREYTNAVPVTTAQLKESDQKIINAYYDIGGFYKDDLKDNGEAIKAYQVLLSRFPSNTYKPSVYFNLSRLYSGTDNAKAAQYRQLLLAEFPESLYAKVLLDPDYSRKADEKVIALTAAYNETYAAYAGKQYGNAATLAQQALVKFGPTRLSAQFAYLAALGNGHLQKIDSLETAFKTLVNLYPADSIVTPLVKQQLTFIKDNREMLRQRPVALVDTDPDAPVLVAATPADTQQSLISPPVTQTPVAEKPTENVATIPVKPGLPVPKPEEKPAAAATAIPEKTAAILPAVVPQKPAPLYDLPLAADYYFVINVADPNTNLSPSRFGLGQFNRSGFPKAGISHQVKDVNNENQLLYVGKFSSFADVKAYEAKILPLMRDIMKISAEKYNTFVITSKELDKLNDRKAVEQYSNFYRNQ